MSDSMQINISGHDIVMHGIFPCPQPGNSLKLWFGSLGKDANFGLHTDVTVRVRQQGLDAYQHLKHKAELVPHHQLNA